MELLVLKLGQEQESSANRFEVVVVVSEIWTAERSEVWAECVIYMSSSSEFSISTETINCSPVKPDDFGY